MDDRPLVADRRVDAARKTAFQVLARAEEGGRINDVLHQALAGASLAERERRFVTELVMGTTRMQGRLDADLSGCYRGRYDRLEKGVKRLLRLGAYQLRYMDSVPPHAALSTTVELAREVNLVRAAGLVNGVLRALGRRSPPPPLAGLRAGTSVEELAAAYSHPVWLVERWLNRWGHDRTVALMEWNNRPPVIWLRQRNDEALRKRLIELAGDKGLSLRPHPTLPDYVTPEPSPAPLLEPDAMQAGLFIVQDPSSGAVIEAVDPQPGEVIIDLCAGPGGKTAALADRVGPKGRILACEIDHQRVNQINATLGRLGLGNVDLYPGDATSQALPQADKIMVDAPCTGTGVMSRRADLRWRRQPEHLAEMTTLQMSLLQHAARHLRPGGTLIYATCSLEPEENRELIQQFQHAHPDFYLVPMPGGVPQDWIDQDGALSTFPPNHHVDGIFTARLSVMIPSGQV